MTEPWALLVRSGGAVAFNTLLREDALFWTQIK